MQIGRIVRLSGHLVTPLRGKSKSADMEEEPGVGGLEPGLAEPGLTGLAGLESAGIEPPASPRHFNP